MYKYFFLLTAFSCFVFVSCEGQETGKRNKTSFRNEDKGEILFSLEDEKFTERDFRDWVKTIHKRKRKLGSKLKKRLFKRYIRNKMVLKSAMEEDYSSRASVIRVMEREIVRLFLREKLHNQIKKRVPTNKEIYDFYKKNINLFTRFEKRRASIIQILCTKKTDCKEQALKIRKMKMLGKSFGILARRYSSHSFSKFNNGDIGFVSHPRASKGKYETFRNCIAKKLFKLNKVGDVSTPFLCNRNVLLVKLTMKLPYKQMSFEKQRMRARSLLQRERESIFVKRFYETMEKKSNLIIHKENLKRFIHK
ncbi:MAG: hypothetical protein CL920_22250 [Deltaproteobacteria bacterium]|nr:hypothetical protein [Deltaproteobacteria bacterium]MBU51420.1 hypothetical protein [Deltaproteobacteria bacterium]|tara:strand:+ start:2469 stop:3389 length:921 start_codon:yes stop_codon:yes gene_type:complete